MSARGTADLVPSRLGVEFVITPIPPVTLVLEAHDV